MELLPIASLALTTVIAFFAGWIAWQQKETARNKLKLDLFERRMQIHDLVRQTISAGPLSPDQERTYLVGTKSARWLFNDQIAEYLDKDIWEKLVDLTALHTELVPELVGEQRTANIQQQREIKNWLTAQRRVMDQKFEQFLRLSH